MSEDLRALVEQYHSFYEVIPYYILFEERPHGTTAVRRRIQAGFDINVYGVTANLKREPYSDYVLACAEFQKVVETVRPHTRDRCSIELIPFPSTVILDTRRRLQPEAMVRIRITHTRGLDQPAGASEEGALKEIEEQLRGLGIRA
jgi:hypothetical protein